MVKVQEYELQEDLYYWDGGEKGLGQSWAQVEADGLVKVGITDLAQKLAGKILFIRIKPPGRAIEQGQDVATLETGKWVGPVESPVTGVIKEVNRRLRRRPGPLNDDPYGDGWVAKLQPSNPEEIHDLLHGEGLIEWYEKEIEEKSKKIKKES